MPELPLSAEEINPDGRRPWAMDDGELAKQIWNKLEPDTQEFLQVLIEDPQQRLALREIAQRMRSRPEHLNQQILFRAGTLCKQYGMQRLWRYPPQPYRIAVYWMDEVVAGLLRNAEYADEPAGQR